MRVRVIFIASNELLPLLTISQRSIFYQSSQFFTVINEKSRSGLQKFTIWDLQITDSDDLFLYQQQNTK